MVVEGWLGQGIVAGLDHVMTVGEALPVNSSSLDSLRPMSTRGRRTSAVMSPCLDTSGSYFSMYIRTVAPTEPGYLNGRLSQPYERSIATSLKKPVSISFLGNAVPAAVYLIWLGIALVHIAAGAISASLQYRIYSDFSVLL